MPSTFSKEDIERAAEAIEGEVYRTPTINARNLGKETGCTLLIKTETLQRTGSYKERGALNKLLSLRPEERERGVIAASAGNHAQGLAYHATRLGIDCTIVMPTKTPLVKLSRTEHLGGRVVVTGATFDDAYAHARELEKERGLIFVHPFDDPKIIAGQGTIGVEIIKERRTLGFRGGPLPEHLDAVVIPVGGGGLIGGVATYLKETRPEIEVIGVEPETCPAMKRSIEEGRIITLDSSNSIADGIAVKRVGELTFELAKKYVDDILLVGENMIAAAILLLLEQERLVCEGAGAAGLAAVMSNPDRFAGRTVLIPLTGGNIDVNILQRIIARGLAVSGRNITVRVRYRDVSGAMQEALRVIAQHGGNILHIEHHRFASLVPHGYVDASLILETKGSKHADIIECALKEEGYLVEGDEFRRGSLNLRRDTI